MRTPHFAALAALLGLGLVVAAYLTRLHLDLFYGAAVGEAICDFAGFSCSTVNAAPESEIFGIPQALLAIPTYLVALGLGAWSWRRQDRGAARLLGLIGLLTVAYSAWLAWLSATVIGAWCLFCILLYAVNLGFAAIGLLAGRGGRPGAGHLLVSAGATLVLGALAWGAYDQARSRLVAESAAAVLELAPATATATSASETRKLRLGTRREGVEIPSGVPVKGPASAPVRIVEYSDFQCPFCRRLQAGLRQLGEEYPQQVRVAYVHFPMNTDCNDTGLKKSMHPAACTAAVAASCAQQQDRFWEMHDWLFEHQAELGRPSYEAGASALGLDLARFRSCLDDPAMFAEVRRQAATGGPIGVGGTPTFFVNGRLMSGGQPIEVLRAVVEAELAGQEGALELEVAVGTELIGPVSGGPAVEVGGVAVDRYEASLDGGRALSRAGAPSARGLSWFEARDACAAAGRRLCTEAEWLAACTGAAPKDADGDGIYSNDEILGAKYGYGDLRRDGACADSRNPDDPGEVLSGNHPRCTTPAGLYDMVGGVKEWVGLSADTAAVKGGSYSSGESARCGYYRDDLAPETRDAATGFRCCEGPAEVPVATPGREVGKALGELELPLLDGGSLRTESLRGRPLILNFWASWCAPCKKELPMLAKLYEAHKASGLELVAVSVDTDEAALRAWLAAHALPFPIARDPGGRLLDSFTRRGVPTTLWIKRDGSIRLRTVGVPPGKEKRLEELVRELVEG